MKRAHAWLLSWVVVLGVMTPAAPTIGDDAIEAQRFIESMAEEAVATLTATGLPREEQRARFRTLLRSYFDVPTIGRWVMGRYWRKATDEQRTEYLALFEALIVTTYAERFSQYSGEKLAVNRTLTNEESGDLLVFSRLVPPGGGEGVEVAWRVRGQTGNFVVVDVVVEGVSMGQTQRSEFASLIRRNGGKVEALLDELRRRTQNDA